LKIVIDEIKLHFKERRAVRHGGGAQAARRDIKRNIPPMIDQRSLCQPHLSDNLCPHVERCSRVFPCFEGKWWPRFWNLDWLRHSLLLLRCKSRRLCGW